MRQSMVLREVRPGLQERIDTPKQVRITPEFAEAVRRESHSTLLKEIIEEALRENDASSVNKGQ
jgi:hypothetical protein